MKKIAIVMLLMLRCAPLYAALSTPSELEELKKQIQSATPIDFVWMQPVNLWSRDSNVNTFDGRLYRLFTTENETQAGKNLGAEIAAYLNDPKNERLLLLRKTIAVLRLKSAEKADKSDPYANVNPDTREQIYFQTTDLFGQSGPMTHINIPNLILPGEWRRKNYHSASLNDGVVVWGYLSLAGSPERPLADLFADRKLFEHFIVHLSLRLVEAEVRGQKKGLEAHLGAHTGPEVNLAYGATWCENRGFYEGWALAVRALLTDLFPRAFIPPQWKELREKDRFLYFSTDPWNDQFEPLASVRKGWNTPQGPLSSHWINAYFLYKVFQERKLEKPFFKSWEILAASGSANLRGFFHDWLGKYPVDREVLNQTLVDATRFQNPISPFSCVGDDVWIGIPPKFDHVNFNASSADSIKSILSRLSERIPVGERQAWIQYPNEDGTTENMFDLLAEELVKERVKRCKQFQDIQTVTHFITGFADEHKIRRRSVMPMLKVISESKVELDRFYAEERERLHRIGVY